MQKTTKNLHDDTTPQQAATDSKDSLSSQDRVRKAIQGISELKQKTKYGILRCDYEYTPTRGDAGDPGTLTYDGSPEPIILKVEGWTFEAAQRGVSASGAYPASEFRLTKADGTVDAYWTKLWEAYDKRDGYVQGMFDMLKRCLHLLRFSLNHCFISKEKGERR